MKVHYPKLYNMSHLLSLNVFTASKGSNNYILSNINKNMIMYSISGVGTQSLVTRQLANMPFCWCVCVCVRGGGGYRRGSSIGVEHRTVIREVLGSIPSGGTVTCS